MCSAVLHTYHPHTRAPPVLDTHATDSIMKICHKYAAHMLSIFVHKVPQSMHMLSIYFVTHGEVSLHYAFTPRDGAWAHRYYNLLSKNVGQYLHTRSCNAPEFGEYANLV